MPHKDRAARLAYLERYRAEHRPSPEVQERRGLPPIGALEYSSDGTRVRCHCCGAWLGSLNTHLRTHGLTADLYREIYEIKRTQSLLPPVTADRYRESSLAHGSWETLVEHRHPTTGRPAGIKHRLQTRVEASRARKGINTRGGGKTRRDDEP